MYRVLKRARMCGKLKAFFGDKNQSKTTVLMKDFKVLKYFFAFSYAKGFSFPKASRTISIGP